MIERVFQLYVIRSLGQGRLVKQFEMDIKKGDLERVMVKAKSLSLRNPVGSVIQAGAQAALDMGGREEIQSRMDEVLLAENSRMEKRTGLLAMLGNAGTLLGLLGTIVGLIQSFSSVANVNPVEKATLLTQGIALAMNTTAYGLIMAIPALIAFGVLQNRANQLSDDLNQGALRAFNWLSFSYESVPKRTRRMKTT
ncbi:MAG: MotA/TolQ/ExbB proton channel family protein [Bdellovibrionaceae bacterium]|nr:MotA/TolQ/ExbB proton channel family protein [Bdellovibrionales bacterium]MCB9083082.1 MotA/TolQ/ExbB proton channel family protein [Pseudobdellovibrionaceae bacterium]